MSISDSIKHSQSLLAQISSHPVVSSNEEIQQALTLLTAELSNIDIKAHKLLKNESESLPSETQPEIKSGCYIFVNEKGYFCPNCYDNQGNKVATTRLNRKLRVCPACRKSIK
jgi:hypothetical protein